jgi:hypothetical protein
MLSKDNLDVGKEENILKAFLPIFFLPKSTCFLSLLKKVLTESNVITDV